MGFTFATYRACSEPGSSNTWCPGSMDTLAAPFRLALESWGTERKSRAGRKQGQTQPRQAGGEEPGWTTCSSSRAQGSRGTFLARRLPAGARTEKAGFLHAGFMCPLVSRAVARPRERQSLPPGAVFPREEV